MQTTIKTVIFAQRLRRRLAALKKARPGELYLYQLALARWRRDLKAWLRKHGPARVDDLKPERGTRYFRAPPFPIGGFFEGAPAPPAYPDDKLIREITNLLRQLSITGQKTVRVSTEEVGRYLGEAEPEVES